MLSCEFCGISKNTFFTENLRTSASDNSILTSLAHFKFMLLRKKSPYSEFFWSVFFRIRTEYGGIRKKTKKGWKLFALGKLSTNIYGQVVVTLFSKIRRAFRILSNVYGEAVIQRFSVKKVLLEIL